MSLSLTSCRISAPSRRHFFSQRLKVYFEAGSADAGRRTFALDALQRYGLVKACSAPPGRAGQPRTGAAGQARRLQACGLLPLAGFGEALQAS
jgi:exodeoxyribonuclease V gamma subunit